ncbi:ATP-binding protein [Actinoplanes sp. GCM10030250]|uniref:ATP-binding protein n=1 Tax=Actinoplanes sp. GCM10030250 TaxID=3273376 RepID=UPI00361D8AB5
MDDSTATGVPIDHLDTSGTADLSAVTTLTYPISPDYVSSWTEVRALSELIANALDEDPDARVSWADGVMIIADDGPGIPEEGLVLGHSTKATDQIGQFGEGKKLAALVLARSPQIGQVRCETVGYGFTPSVQRRRLLGGLVPSLSQQGAELLVYHLYRTGRVKGTVFTVECSRELAEEARSRFRAITEPGYRPPAAPGQCVLDGEPGRIWIGGVLVNVQPDLLASYDLPLDAKGMQNRDRTVVDAGALRTAVRAMLATSQDEQIIARFAQHVLGGGKLAEPEQFFSDVYEPYARAAWRWWSRTHLPDLAYYTTTGNEQAALDLIDNGYTEITADGLPSYLQRSLMDLLGVEVAQTRQTRHYERARNKTTWVPDKALTSAEREVLTSCRDLVRRAIGPFALDRVRVYSASEESPCADGFYTPSTGDTAIHRAVLADRHRSLLVLIHEAAHRVAHRGGGRWLPIPDYRDRSRGFERVLSDFAAVLLGYLAVDTPLLAVVDLPAPTGRQRRLAPANDPAVPAVRRELAHLLHDRLPEAIADGGFRDAKDLVASTAVHPDYWRTLTQPKVAGHRQQRGGRAWDYDKNALLAAAAGVHPPVVWLGYHLCEGPLHGRPRARWGQPGRWTKKMRDAIDRACTDLETLGAPYAQHIPALHALAEGQTPAAMDDDSWHAPARALIALERRRLGLSLDTREDSGSRTPGPVTAGAVDNERNPTPDCP